eukprot:4411638-Amphidinium_carterae.1
MAANRALGNCRQSATSFQSLARAPSEVSALSLKSVKYLTVAWSHDPFCSLSCNPPLVPLEDMQPVNH